MSSTAAVASAVEELSGLARPSFAIGNAGDEVISRQYNGHIYRWEPREKKSIGDQMDYPRDTKGAIPRDRSGDIRVAPSVLRLESLKVVKAIFAEDDGFRGAECGLYLIRGDGKDDAREALARTAYKQMRVARAERGQAAWVELTENRKPGDPALVAPQKLRDDIAFLAAERAGLIDRKAFWSKFGDFESDERAAVAEHLRVSWPEQWALKGEGLIIARAEIAPVPQAVKAPAVSPSKATLDELPESKPAQEEMGTSAASAPAPGFETNLDFVVKKAEALDTTLTTAEITAVVMNDEPAVDALMERLGVLELALRAQGGQK